MATYLVIDIKKQVVIGRHLSLARAAIDAQLSVGEGHTIRIRREHENIQRSDDQIATSCDLQSWDQAWLHSNGF